MRYILAIVAAVSSAVAIILLLKKFGILKNTQEVIIQRDEYGRIVNIVVKRSIKLGGKYE